MARFAWPGCVGNSTVCLLVFSPALRHVVANPLGSSVARPSGDRRATELFIVCRIEGKLIGERGERSKGDSVGEVHMIPRLGASTRLCRGRAWREKCIESCDHRPGIRVGIRRGS